MHTFFRPTTARRPAFSAGAGLLAIWMLAGAAPSAASPAGPEAGPFGPRQMQHLTRHLDLSDAQRERIGEIVKASRSEGEKLRTELRTLRTELQAAVKAEEFYPDQVRILIESQAPAMTELMLLGARTMHAVRAELTPEQQAEADAMLEKFAAGRGRRGFGRRHGR